MAKAINPGLRHRAGRSITQPDGYQTFQPAPLPPDPPLDVDGSLLTLLSKADIALGRLDGLIEVVPDPDLFVGMYVRREAVVSSQIEGTQSTLEDLLEVELEPTGGEGTDVQDIVNYVGAMKHGLERLGALPISLRLIREIHAELLRDGRGASKAPGEFRRTQNWIGPEGATPKQATFVPPTVPDMKEALGDLERFLHSDAELPVLIEVGLAHAQFETIHPFLDGNGRVGRLMITLLLVERGVLRRPLLYLSHHFKLHRAEYYDRLTAIRRDGDWEGWLRFFLRGVVETAEEARTTAERIFELREHHRSLVLDQNLGQKALKLLSHLFNHPLITVRIAANVIEATFVTANRLVARFEELGILREVTGKKRSRIFRYEPYVSLFDDPQEGLADEPIEVTETSD